MNDYLAWFASQPCCPCWTGWFGGYARWKILWLLGWKCKRDVPCLIISFVSKDYAGCIAFFSSM